MMTIMQIPACIRLGKHSAVEHKAPSCGVPFARMNFHPCLKGLNQVIATSACSHLGVLPREVPVVALQAGNGEAPLRREIERLCRSRVKKGVIDGCPTHTLPLNAFTESQGALAKHTAHHSPSPCGSPPPKSPASPPSPAPPPPWPPCTHPP